MSNLAKTCRDVKDVIREHRVYGAESVIRSIVNVNEDPYLTREEMIKIVNDAFDDRDAIPFC